MFVLRRPASAAIAAGEQKAGAGSCAASRRVRAETIMARSPVGPMGLRRPALHPYADECGSVRKEAKKSDVAAIFINSPAGCQRVLLLPDIVSRDLPKARGRQKRSVRSDEIRRIRKLICGGWPIIRSRT